MPTPSLLAALMSTAIGSGAFWAGPTKGSAELSGTRWSQLRPAEDQPPAPPVVDRTLELERVPGGVTVRGRWRLYSPEPRWFANQLFGASAHVERAQWNGRPATLWASDSGILLVGRVEGEVVVEATAFVPGALDVGMTLPVLGATRGTIEIVGSGDELRIVDQSGLPVLRRDATHHVSGAASMAIAPKPGAMTGGTETLAIARVGVGLTVGDAEIRGRARVRWEIRRGALDRVALQADGLGADLEVEGPNVSTWDRSGDQIVIELREPATTGLDVALHWTVPVSKAAESTAALPRLVPQAVFRTEASLQLARDGEVDVIPEIDTWTAIAAAQLPTWGEGLVEGNPTASYRKSDATSDDSTLSLVRFVPVPGPPMVIEIADVRVASTQEGRGIMRVRYEVLNERAPFLRMQPPPGTRVVGVTVGGRPVRPGLVDGTYAIPLQRSIETLEGLVTVPVVVGMVSEGEAWERRHRGSVELPVVDAPINVVRATHVLPRGYESRLGPGDGAVVEAFSRGHEVAYGLDDDRAASQADQIFADAVDAWNNNEFRNARDKLGQLESMGANHKNVGGLEANVDMILGPEAPPPQPGVTSSPSPITGPITSPITPDGAEIMGKAQSQMARRIRAQARARSGEKRARLRGKKQKAKDLKASGKYDAAAAELESALEEAKELEALEDEESKTYDFEQDVIEAELSTTRTEAANREQLETQSKRSVEIDFGEYDLVTSGRTFGFGPSTGQSPASLDVRPALPPPVVPILVPVAGQPVHHEFLLLEPEARRSLEIHARHPTGGFSR